MASVNQDFTEDIKNYISINEILQVRIMDDPASPTCYSRINDITEGRMFIAWPTHHGTRLIVRRDQMLTFLIMRGEVPHEFGGLVDELDPTAKIPQIAIIPGSSIIRIQRRQNFRIKTLIPANIVAQIVDAKDDAPSTIAIQTITWDISAGGISIKHLTRFPENAPMEIKLALPDGGPTIKLPCRVVYSDPQAENLSLYRTGICYLMITEKERARIVRFVYRTQLRRLHP